MWWAGPWVAHGTLCAPLTKLFENEILWCQRDFLSFSGELDTGKFSETDMLTVVRSRLQKESTFSFILRQINFATKVLCGWQQICFFFAGWLILVVEFAPRIWHIFWMLKRIQQTNTFLLPNKSESGDLGEISFSNKTIHILWSHQRNAQKTLILVKFLLRVVFSRFTHCRLRKKWSFSVCVTDMCLHRQIRFSHFHPIVLFRLEPWISHRRRIH